MDMLDFETFADDGFDLDGFDTDTDFFDDYDGYDLEDEWLGDVLKGLGGAAASAAEGAYGRHGSKWLMGKAGSSAKSRSRYGLADSAIRGALGGLRIMFNSPNFEDGDSFEPEYESDAIDEMEALLEDALEADAEDAALSADEMVARSFGAMRGARQIRPLMAALSKEMRRIMAMARRNPRLRALARIAPLALRRTAVVLMKMIAARRPVNLSLAVRIFRGLLQRMARSSRMRRAALHRARLRARRARGRVRSPRGAPYHGPRPRPVAMPSYGY